MGAMLGAPILNHCEGRMNRRTSFATVLNALIATRGFSGKVAAVTRDPDPSQPVIPDGVPIGVSVAGESWLDPKDNQIKVRLRDRRRRQTTPADDRPGLTCAQVLQVNRESLETIVKAVLPLLQRKQPHPSLDSHAIRST